MVSEILWHDGVLGVSTIGIVTGIDGARAKILLFPSAKAAGAVHVSKPGNSDPLSKAKLCDAGADIIDLSHDLVTWNERLSMQFEIAFDNMNIAAANGADIYFDSNLIGGRDRLIDLLQNQRRFAHWFLIAQHHRPHRVKKAESGKLKAQT